MSTGRRSRKRLLCWLIIPLFLICLATLLALMKDDSPSSKLKVLQGLVRTDHRLDVYEFRTGIGTGKKVSAYAFETETFKTSKTIRELREVMDHDVDAPKPTVKEGSNKYYFYNWSDSMNNRSRTLTLLRGLDGSIKVSYTELREASWWDRFRSWLDGFGRSKGKDVLPHP